MNTEIKRLIKFIFPHRHLHTKLIVSTYLSFNYRDCIYECKCGHRQAYRVHHDNVYPHPTSSISFTEFNNLLK